MYKGQTTERPADRRWSVGVGTCVASSPDLGLLIHSHIVIEERIRQAGRLPVWVADPSGTVERMLVCDAVAREVAEVGWP